MAEATFRIPSRTVQYGYVEIAIPHEVGTPPELMAAAYVNYVYAFQREEEATIKRLKEGVSAPQGASEGARKPKYRSVNQILSDEDVDTVAEAQAILDKELGGVTEVENEESPTDQAGAPWDRPAAEVKKPWETGTSTPDKVVEGLGSGW